MGFGEGPPERMNRWRREDHVADLPQPDEKDALRN
jgi:hypothetical protein